MAPRAGAGKVLPMGRYLSRIRPKSLRKVAANATRIEGQTRATFREHSDRMQEIERDHARRLRVQRILINVLLVMVAISWLAAVAFWIFG